MRKKRSGQARNWLAPAFLECLFGNKEFFFRFQLLQNLGKADKTTDDIFDEHLLNFNIQQSNANRLHKDITNYIRCVKGGAESEALI